uniref:TRAP transporter small permease n=1 Tax=candidate division WOR-3 bacterium TaxID=2052148 RepID=A0A7C2P4J4_UNCW3
MNTFRKLVLWLMLSAGAFLFFAMGINICDIISTKIFKVSIPGTIDFTEECMVFLTMLPLAFVALEKKHIKFSILEEQFSPKVKKLMKLIQYVLSLGISGFVCVRTFYNFLQSVKVMEMKRGVDLPIWPATFIVFFSFLILTLVWGVLLVESLEDKDGT